MGNGTIQSTTKQPVCNEYCFTGPKSVEYGKVFIRWDNSYRPPIESEEEEEPLREPPFICYQNGMLESLQGPKWERIKWYYHCDDAWGNTIRLYDQEHYSLGNNANLYLEKQANYGFLGNREDRVLIRSENIGTTKNLLKQRMFSIFEPLFWPSTSAPTDENRPTPRCNVEKLCEQFLARRLAYFQNPQRNNMPGYEPFKSCDIDLCFPEPIPPDDPTPREARAFRRLQEVIKSRRENFQRCTKSGVI